jgi:hypothetical protein
MVHRELKEQQEGFVIVTATIDEIPEEDESWSSTGRRDPLGMIENVRESEQVGVQVADDPEWLGDDMLIADNGGFATLRAMVVEEQAPFARRFTQPAPNAIERDRASRGQGGVE